MTTRYFVAEGYEQDGVPPAEKEVTREQFIAAESRSGFHTKTASPVATGGFSHSTNTAFGWYSIRGRIETEPDGFAD